jgi:heme a synthase
VLQLVGVLALGGLQAFVGWFMVQSGLVDRVSVSPIRLAMHLTLAVLVFAAVLWLALSERAAAVVRSRMAAPPAPVAPAAVILALILLQIVLGAFVAGLKAGYTYNTWPLMDGRLIPNGLGTLSPWALNLVENITAVQFNHRMVAYLLLASVLWHAWRLMAMGAQGDLRRSGMTLAATVVAQALLGIWTLLAVVPLALGLAHQIGAFIVVAAAIWHLHVAVASRR